MPQIYGLASKHRKRLILLGLSKSSFEQRGNVHSMNLLLINYLLLVKIS